MATALTTEWLLTEEEREAAVVGAGVPFNRQTVVEEALNKAQLWKVAELGNEPCPHDEPPPERQTIPRRMCLTCHEQLGKEAGMEGAE